MSSLCQSDVWSETSADYFSTVLTDSWQTRLTKHSPCSHVQTSCSAECRANWRPGQTRGRRAELVCRRTHSSCVCPSSDYNHFVVCWSVLMFVLINHWRFKHAVLGTHLSYLGCLSRTVSCCFYLYLRLYLLKVQVRSPGHILQLLGR